MFGLKAKLEERYLQDADVSVLITPGTQQVLTVEGDVNSPGMFAMDAEMTLLSAVAKSGGLSDRADANNVYIFRQIDGERVAATFNLKAIRNGEAEDPQVYGNDIVVVDTSGARGIYGEVIRSVPLLGLFVRAQTGGGVSSRR